MARNLGTDVLEAALIGFGIQRDALQKKIDELKAQLGRGVSKSAPAPRPKTKSKKSHRISPEGLKRIREAQKRRWAAAKSAAASA